MKKLNGLLIISLFIFGCADQNRLIQLKSVDPSGGANAGSAGQTSAQQLESQIQQAQIQLQQKEATKTSLDSCRELTEPEAILINSSFVHIQEKRKVIDNLLVTLRGAECEKFVTNLRLKFVNEPIIEAVNMRVEQLAKINSTNVKPEDKADILEDMVASNPEISFDASDLWQAVTSLEVDSNTVPEKILVNGKIISNKKTYSISSILEKSATENPEKLTVQEISKFNRGLTANFINGEFKISKTATSQQSANELFDIKKKVVRGTSAQSTPSQSNDPRFVFDSRDQEKLNNCGAQFYVESLFKNRKVFHLDNGIKSEMIVTGLKLNKEDPLSTEKLFSSVQKQYIDYNIASYVLETNKDQKAEKQGFWIFSKDGERGIEISSLIRNKVEEFKKPNGMIKFNAMAKKFNMNSQVEKKSDGGALSFKIKSNVSVGPFEAFSLSTDVETAYWLKRGAERIAQCMEKNNESPLGVSRDSALNFLLFKIFEKNLYTLPFEIKNLQ